MIDRKIRILITLISVLITGCFLSAKTYAGLQFAIPSKFTTQTFRSHVKTKQEEATIIIPDIGKPILLTPPRRDKEETNYVITVKSGQYKDGILTLNNAPLVTRFDKEVRQSAIALLPNQFFPDWASLVTGENDTPPKATLAIYTKDGTSNIALNLKDPQLNNDSVSFDAKVITGVLPKHFTLSTLFIKTQLDTTPLMSAFEQTLVSTITPIASENKATQQDKTQNSTSQDRLTSKFTQAYLITSKNGSFLNGKLTLDNAPTALLFQKDKYSHQSLYAFADKIENNVLKNQAAVETYLMLYSQTNASKITLKLSNLQVQSNELIFDAEIVNGQLPEKFRLSTLFINTP